MGDSFGLAWTRRRVAALPLFSGLGAMLAACARQDSGAPSKADQPATIQFWPTWQGQFQVDGMTKMAQQFHAEHETLSVEITPYASKYEKIIAAVAGGTPPDMHTLPTDQMGTFAHQKLTQVLDAYVAKSGLKDHFYPAQWETASAEGKIHGVAGWDHHPNPFLFWNQAHFEEVGYPADKPPTTLEEARRYAERLNKANSDGSLARMAFDPLAETASSLLGFWAKAYSVTWYDDKTHKLNLVQPGLVAALDYIVGLYKLYGPDQVKAYRQKYPTFNSANAGMPQGVESMKISSGVSTGTLQNNAPSVRVGIGWGPLEKPRKVIEVGGGHFNCLATGAAHSDQAWRFVEWLTSPTANQLMMESIGWIAYNKELAKGLDVKRYPNMRFVLEAPAKADEVKAPITLPVPTKPIDDGIQRVINGQQGPREMLADAQTQLQNDLDAALRNG